ncbi:MAG: GNAT family N-acetyltransferase [Bacteroidota bacterium]
MTVTIKTFEALTKSELYGILQLRSEVFVVEQDCVYQDIDGKDQVAWHVMGYEQDTLIAYIRVFKPGDYFEHTGIGRVVVKKGQRKNGQGRKIMEASILMITKTLGYDKIVLSAQTYLKEFYNSLGFIERGEAYLEDGIPHIHMVKTN